MRRLVTVLFVVLACFVVLASQHQITPILAQKITDDARPDSPLAFPRDVPRELKGSPVTPTARAVVNMTDLARRQAETPSDLTPGVMVPPNPIYNEEDTLQPNDLVPSAVDLPASADTPTSNRPSTPNIASPSPATSYLGHNDVVKVGTATVVIPPDTTGAVGLTKVVTSLNNNFVIQDKTTGAVLSAVSMDTFWAATGATGTFDPRIIYDPYNSRWIVSGVSDAVAAASSILIGVSTSSDPSGTYTLFRFDADSTDANWADFPLVGFNKDWVSINVNMIIISGGGIPNKNLVLDYAMLRAGAFTGTVFSGSGFCTSPAITYSTTEATLYMPTHLSSAGATYRVDTITGAPPTPVYTIGATKTRTGGAWVQPIGQLLPQAAPLAGVSSCGATPCPLETQDAQIRSNPIFRNGFIYYAQTVGLPSGGLTHTAAQWTKLTASTRDFAEGGRVDDATATSTNGGKWYAYPSISVNVNNDVMFGFSQFSSSQFPSAGYTYRFHSDAPGLMRDPIIYKAGEDYYNKTFGTGRNRYGDYSMTQVDPSNDQDLWTLQEYTQARVGTDDGTGANSSRWSTWWAKVAFDPTAAGLAIGGRIQTAAGRSISRAVVTLVDSTGRIRTALSNPFGRYQFEDVAANETYLLNVTAKGYEFTPQVITVTQAVNNLDFTAQ